MMLDPVIPEQGLVMVYAARGIGKTFLGLSIAYAVASGSRILRWAAPRPNPVLYVDGEMPLPALQERLRAIAGSASTSSPDHHFFILPADAFECDLPNLATEAGQKAIEPFLEGISFVVLDNLSTLATTERDNDVDSWSSMQRWLLKLRRRGISVLIIHHAAKGGQQRGTSRREDVLDTVISLKASHDYSAAEGIRFEVHFEKARGLQGASVEPFEASLKTEDGNIVWIERDLVDVDAERARKLQCEGLSIRDIAGRMNLSRSKVGRLLKRSK